MAAARGATGLTAAAPRDGGGARRDGLDGGGVARGSTGSTAAARRDGDGARRDGGGARRDGRTPVQKGVSYEAEEKEGQSRGCCECSGSILNEHDTAAAAAAATPRWLVS